jgi:hypothetical protein
MGCLQVSANAEGDNSQQLTGAGKQDARNMRSSTISSK